MRRPAGFPQSVVLCGVRDVRDYRIRSSAEKTVVAGGSAFNVKARSMRLGDFSRDDVTALLAQHTGETGAGVRTRGAGNDLGADPRPAVAGERVGGRDLFPGTNPGVTRSRPITADDVRGAQERIIQRRETHLDQLADKLQEDRVRRVVEPLLSGGEERDFSARDIEYVRDLGPRCR